MEIIKEETKKLIFNKAKKASDSLVFWNAPNQKRHLSELDQQELEYKLWKDNKLDGLVYKRLGDDGWNNYKSQKLSDDDINILIQETKTLNIFLNSLPKRPQ